MSKQFLVLPSSVSNNLLIPQERKTDKRKTVDSYRACIYCSCGVVCFTNPRDELLVYLRYRLDPHTMADHLIP